MTRPGMHPKMAAIAALGLLAAGAPSGNVAAGDACLPGPMSPVGIPCGYPAAGAADAPAFEIRLEPDRRGRRSDTRHFLAYQVASIAILYTLPESTTGWTTEQKKNYSLGQWWDNVRHPEWDSDDFFVNYVAHPYWGAAYFVRSRERGYGNLDSFWYAAALSASYEFGAEALFEEPSIQDLIVTPVGGWLLGRYFMRVRKDMTRGRDATGELPFHQKFVITLTDPLGAINNTVDRWLGLEHRFNVRPFLRTQRIRDRVDGDHAASEDSEQLIGITFSYRW